MASESGRKHRSAPQADTSVGRRGLIRFGTVLAAFTGTSTFSVLGANSAQAADDRKGPSTYVPTSEKGAPSGVATLGTDTKVPHDQLPDLSAEYASARATNARSMLVTPLGTPEADTAAIQSAVDSAAAAKVPLMVRGDFTINAQINIPSGSDIDFDQARIYQVSATTPVLVLHDIAGVRLRNLRAQGKTSDYANTYGVYRAAAVRITGTSSDVTMIGGSLLGFAGAGVYLGGSVADIRISGCRMTGPGPAYIRDSTYNYSGGIVTERGTTRWTAQENDISGFAQGIVTGDNMTDVRILNNYIHDIPGQHGLYLETVNGGIISGNLLRNIGLLGMKLQVGGTTVNDVDSVNISDNVFIGLGAQGILLTNPSGGTPRLRRINVTGNVVRSTAGSGIVANNCVDLHIADNLLYDVSAGIDVSLSSGVEILDNKIIKTKEVGIRIDSKDVIVDGNRISNPASLNTSSSEFGIHIYGTSADITVRDNKIADSLANMRYGIYVSAGDLPTMDFIGNRVAGATDYGYRGLAQNARSFRGNAFQGTSGPIITPPTNYTVVASPTSDTVGTKAAIDAIRTVLIANGLVP